MLIKFSLLLSLLAVAASEEPNKASATNQQQAELETIQNVNLYLLSGGLELDAPVGSERLSARQLDQMEAIQQTLERVNLELKSMDGHELLEMARLEHGFSALLADKTDARPLVAFFDSLARKRCDQVSLDFLMIVANFKQAEAPTSEQLTDLLIQNYAKLRVQQCWQRFVDSVARKLDSALGKMAAPLFGFVDKLAGGMHAQVQVQSPRRRNAGIQIDSKHESQLDLSDVSSSIDSKDSTKARATIQTLKEIQLDTEPLRKQFASHVRRLQGDYRQTHDYEDRVPSLSLKLESFYDELLRQPCQQLIERVQSIVSAGEIFKGHISQTLGRALAAEKERNVRLDYELQVYRICKLTSQYDSALRRHLSTLT